MLASIILVAAIGGISVVGTKLLDDFLPFYLADIISAVFLAALAFATALVLNLVACPYRLKASDAITGSLLTTALWLVFAVGFAYYTKFASPERLYGKIAAVIIFLLWCYVMMSSFVIGMIKNGSQLPHTATLKIL